MDLAQNSVAATLSTLRSFHETTQNTNVILVPGVGTMLPDSWGICNVPFLDMLALLNQGIIIRAYEHNLMLNNQFSWESLLEEGGSFSKACKLLWRHRRNPNQCYSFAMGLVALF
ncbi:tetratricopeptide repeat domain-containing protein [Penicillium malachiteum]|nr:tetratricopeptide repeat domain-containing protein [Penicillium malachiteum]